MSENQTDMVRSFAAVSLPHEIQERLGSIGLRFRKRLEHARAHITWVRPDSLHLTLKFLGSIESRIVPSIMEQLEKAAAGTPPFTFMVGELGVFPNLNQPRVIWVGVHRGEKELCAIQKRVEENLSTLGFAVEKRGFSPHLTLGRIKSLGSRGEVLRALKELDNEEIGMVEVTRIHLMKSTLTPTGAIYTELGSVVLKKG
jgi:2'-5' RNA ligase